MNIALLKDTPDIYKNFASFIERTIYTQYHKPHILMYKLTLDSATPDYFFKILSPTVKIYLCFVQLVTENA